MKLRFNLFNMLNAISFVLAFLCLMFSYASQYMYLPSMLFFGIGFGMLTYTMVLIYLKNQREIEEKQDVIVMELAENSNGEAYVMQDEKNDKKLRRKKRAQRIDRLLPSILCFVATGFMIYMFITTIVRLV